jgi:hypothetical protein
MLPIDSGPELTWVTEAFRRAVKSARRPQYRLGADVGMHPTLLSQVLNRRRQIPVGDWRIVRIARRVGLAPHLAFEEPPRELRRCPPQPPAPADAGVGAAVEGPPAA